MKAKAILKTIRITPRKAQLVARLVRRKSVINALSILQTVNKRSSYFLIKLINSAVANSVYKYNTDVNKLVITELLVTEGPTLKRMRPSDHGQAYRILKRTSTITVVVESLGGEVNGSKS